MNFTSKQCLLAVYSLKKLYMKENNNNNQEFLFNEVNYKFLLIGIAVIVLGFILMMGGGSDDPKVFNEAELFSFTRIRIAPTTVLIGFGITIYSIFKKPAISKS